MYLLDTDIVIYSLKGEPRVVESFARNAAAPKALSIITYGELLYGARKSQRPTENLARVRRVAELFPVMDATRVVMETFAGLKVDLEREGQRLDDFDLIIASTALVLNYRLVTNNERHFTRVSGLFIENWTKAKRAG